MIPSTVRLGQSVQLRSFAFIFTIFVQSISVCDSEGFLKNPYSPVLVRNYVLQSVMLQPFSRADCLFTPVQLYCYIDNHDVRN